MKKIILFILFIFSINTYARLSLTTSGGVSLGVYEAGFLYYSMYQESKSPKRRDDNLIITGASAGAINSFITAIERCSVSSSDPKESLFWKSWIPLNFDKFFIKDSKKSNSLLQRESLSNIFNVLEDRWNHGLKDGCVSTLGMTLTRQTPYELKKSSKLQYTRVQEYLVIKISGNGFGQKPSVTNVYLEGRGSQMFLPFNSSGYTNYNLIKQSLLASSSFPIAFEPMVLDYCMVNSSKNNTCSKGNIEKDLFLDGGIFNNTPLDLAYDIAKNDNDQLKTEFIYFDPSIKNYPISIDDDFSNVQAGVVKDFFRFVKNFITSSRGGQISNFLRNHPKVYDRLLVLKGSFPLASEPLYGFFGFFEEDFRIFDFYMGMLDAKRAHTKKFTPKKNSELDKLNLHLKIIECLDAVLNNHHGTISYCSNLKISEFNNFSALFKVSIESLFNNCIKVDKGKVTENSICKIAQNGTGPEVFGKEWDTDWKKYENESQLAYIMRRLGYHNFKFKDLNVEKEGAEVALVKVKGKITKAIKYSAKVQPTEHRILMNQLVSPFMNYLFYSPKQRRNYLLLGNNSIDLGTSFVVSSSHLSGLYWRYGFGVMLTGVDIIYRPEVQDMGIVPYLGVYGEPIFFSTPLLQYRFGFRAGYQFSSHDNFEIGNCSVNTRSTSVFSKCSDIVLSSVISLSIFETISAEVVISALPFNRNGNNRPTYLSFMAGLEF